MSRQDSETHVKIVAWLHIVLSALVLLVTALVLIVFLGIGLLLATTDEAAAMGIFAVIATIVGGFLFLVSVPGLIGGIGLLQRQNWARILVLILSVLQLFNVPFGTAVGVYSLWVLTRDETAALFGESRGWSE
ncbi:MAG: hypothetical protein OXM03_06510 [Chloroflexota bacterium]|nr:hypothetical protein [Chloroflexota bacterium]MDE2840264.1 hypothetical protein [Chloroflexota bacterium]MDE2931482.1 hypothetical protein [Chloroflexota bacterium]